MKRYWTCCAALLALMLAGCSPSPKITQKQKNNLETLGMDLGLPGYKLMIQKGRLYGQTRKAYIRSVNSLGQEMPDKVVFYARHLDVPDKTPYRAVGTFFSSLDTVKIKTQGFVNRSHKGQPYLYKSSRQDRTVQSEYVVKAGDGFLYLFSYAPIQHLLPNEEDVIIAQDSLRSKFSGIVGSMQPANR